MSKERDTIDAFKKFCKEQGWLYIEPTKIVSDDSDNFKALDAILEEANTPEDTND